MNNGLKLSIECDECGIVGTIDATPGRMFKAPDGWGVFTVMFKIQGVGRIGGLIQRRLSSSGIGQRLMAYYLCPDCLTVPTVRRDRGIEDYCNECGVEADTGELFGRRKITFENDDVGVLR